MDELEQGFRDALSRADTETVPVRPLDPDEIAGRRASARPGGLRGVGRYLAIAAMVAVVIGGGFAVWALFGRGVPAEPAAPGGTAAPAPADLADTSVTRVVIDLYSGRENPVVRLDADTAEQLTLRVADHEAAGEFTSGGELPSGLGFRGFVIYPAGGADPWLRITPDAVYIEDSGAWVADPSGSFYALVWDALRPSLAPEVLDELPDTNPAIPNVGAPVPPQQGSTATWELAHPDQVASDSTSLVLAVTQQECSGGRTGELMAPVVSASVDDVVIRVDAVPLPAGAYDCQGNDAVEVTVTLTEPVGIRHLVDAACLEGDAVRTASCASGAIRWSPTRPSTEPGPKAGEPASTSDEVTLRVLNDDVVRFDSVTITFPDGSVREFGPLAPGEISVYRTVKLAYRYAFVQVLVGDKTFTLEPIDYVGETALEPGLYIYVLKTSGTTVDLELVVDQ